MAIQPPQRFELDDLTHVEREARTIYAPGATPGDVLVVQSDHSLVAAPGGGSQPEGVIQSVDFVFTEEATAGVYTVPPLTLPENGFVLDVQWWPVSDFDWAADTAVLDVVDSAIGTQISAQDVKNVPSFTPVSAADVVGLAKPYVFPFNGVLEPSEATITITITTTIAVPPVVPAAVMIVRVFYLVPPTPVAAVFA